MIEIWEPRYHDGVVLVATHKIKEYPAEIRITKGAYKGDYLIDDGDYPHEKMNTKAGGTIEMTVVPLDKLRKVRESAD